MKKLVLGLALGVSALLSTSVFAQDKPSVAVLEFTNESGAAWWRGGVGWELSSMLTNEMAATKAFRMLERNKIEGVLSEQNLAASGRVQGGTGARIGKLLGAQYLVTGTVSAYEEDTASTGGGLSFGGVSLGGNKSNAYLAVDLRVINATTGEVAFTRTIEGNAKSGGMSIGLYKGGFGGNLSQQKNTPAGKAIRAALVLSSDYLECVMVRQDGCEADFDAADDRRRAKTRDAIDLDD
ncbi:MAG: CsgG/HfaB family protein [Ahniella sp.]|nr:CsgG/HfaB family protein [Ahniella sp.]